MAIAKKLEDEISRSASRSSSSSLLNEALLIDSTMCIIGLQVHVHINDGSIFSGIFYTISLENEFSIVLKNAKLIKKGRSKSNVSSGKIVETLVILSSNIVQIVEEGENVVSAVADFASEPRSCIANKSINSGNDTRGSNHRRQAGARILKCCKQNTDVHREDNVNAQRSSSLDITSECVKAIELSSNGFHDAAERPSSTENSSSQSTTLDENSEMSQVLVASTNRRLPTQSQTTNADKKAKEFKLNPGAKIFSPSLTKRLSSTHAGMTPVNANMGYVPSSTPMLPVPEAVQPEIGISPFLSHASSPSKFVPYPNFAAGYAGGGSHFPQHMAGPTMNRGQPHRFTPQYQSVQATPMLVNPNPQVMVGRSGQLMYMQPISQDLVQGAPHHPQLPSRPLFSPQHLQYPKHQSLISTGQPMQLYAPQPPFAANGHQPYVVMPTNIPLMQPPFPTNRPMPIPVPNGFYGTKFL
ncbi:Polyadenylate-binding protein-interacting protein 3 [Cardamine amara subsp. amara]|uniref:Polyadenylate-binding protein-interacting protein 3 n=1 Tax=Cardamine amara subsp. amara TaxID=228776 RepID=A0ABD1AXV7_CARAN